MEEIKIIELNKNNVFENGICGYKNKKNKGLLGKIDWLNKYFPKGIKHKILYSEKDGSVGGIE